MLRPKGFLNLVELVRCSWHREIMERLELFLSIRVNSNLVAGQNYTILEQTVLGRSLGRVAFRSKHLLNQSMADAVPYLGL